MFRALRTRPGLTALAAVASLAILAIPPPAAAQYTWTGTAGTNWNTAANWSPAGGPPNSSAATASFTGNAIGTINISANESAQSLSFSNPTGNYTLTSSAGVILDSVAAITVSAGVTGVQTINLANVPTNGSLLFGSGNMTITNNSTAAGTTLVIGPNTVIGTPGFGGVVFAGAGTTQLSGTFATSASFGPVGGLTVNGPGNVIVSNPANRYTGGTTINGGTLAVGANGAVIPAGTGVAVAAGGTFDLGPYTNGSANALSGVLLAGGTLRATGATNSDFYTKGLTMFGGTVDFTNTPFTWVHVGTDGINTSASPTTATWIGSNTSGSRIQNDSGSPMSITVAAGTTPSGIDLDAGIALSGSGTNPTFIKAGAGVLRLTNTGNTANITIAGGTLRADDLATNGAGALGSGTITFKGGRLQYGGTNASSAKNFVVDNSVAVFQMLTPGVNLTVNGTISETFSSALTVFGPGASQPPGTLTLTATNNYGGPTNVYDNGIVAILTVSNSGSPGPIGRGSDINLGTGQARGTLLLTGTGAFSTDRAAETAGVYPVGGGAIGVQNAGTTLTWNGQILSGGSFIKTGAGTLTLTNTTNSYTGGTYVEAGTLDVGAAGAVIPANSDVTVSGGATLEAAFSNFSFPLRTVTLNGGTLRTVVSSSYFLNRLVTGDTGGTIDVTGVKSSVEFIGPGAGATINGNSSWTGSINNTVINSSGVTADLNIAPNVVLTCYVPLRNSFRVLGGGTLYMQNTANNASVSYLVSQGRLRADDLSVNGAGASVFGQAAPGFLTLDGGTLQYGGPTASSPMPINLTSAGGTLEVSNSATTLTYTGTLSGFGPLTKAGPGVLILNNPANTFASGLVVSGGRLDVSDDAQLGAANPTVNPAGTLRYTASLATSRTFNLAGGTLEAPAGVTLTLNGAAVNGGFLRGAGTFAVTGGTTLAGTTTLTSTTISQTGPASVTNFTNNGQFTNAAGQSLTWNNGTNTTSGRLTVNGTAYASDLVSNGVLTVNPGGVISNSGTDLYLGGGSTTFVGAPSANGGKIDLGGQNLQLRGGLLVNYGGNAASGGGVRNGTVVVDYGGRAKGTGYYEDVVTQNGGVFSPGGAPGTTPVGTQRFNNGGILNIDVNAAGPNGAPPGGTSGADPGWSRLDVNSFFRFYPTADQHFTISLTSLTTADTAGPVSNFDATRAHSWEVVRLVPGSVFVTGATGTTPADSSAYVPGLVDVQTAGTFLNPLLGGSFATAFQPNGVGTYSVLVNFTPVPEASGVLAACAAAAGWVCFWRRRWRDDLIRSNDSMRRIGRRGLVARP